MRPTIVFVHGAFSSANAFNYFRVCLADYPQLSYTYDWNDPTSDVGCELAAFVVANVTTPTVILIGHSLGGNVAIQSLPHFPLQGGPAVKQVITYASPLGGSSHASMMRLFSTARVFSHIQPKSTQVRMLKRIVRDYPIVTSFVTNRGPLSSMNDGVVTVASQTAIDGIHYIPVATNHMEVLLSDDVITATKTIIDL